MFAFKVYPKLQDKHCKSTMTMTMTMNKTMTMTGKTRYMPLFDIHEIHASQMHLEIHNTPIIKH